MLVRLYSGVVGTSAADALMMKKKKMMMIAITSHGGHLRYTVNYIAGFNSQPTTYPDIEIVVR